MLRLGRHGRADPDLDPVALALGHAAVEAHDQVVGVRARVDLAADLGHPQLDPVVDEDGESQAELVAVEGAGRLADHHRLEAAVGPLERLEQWGRLGAALPRQGPALADVEELGDDQPPSGSMIASARDRCHCFELAGSCWSSVDTRP